MGGCLGTALEFVDMDDLEPAVLPGVRGIARNGTHGGTQYEPANPPHSVDTERHVLINQLYGMINRRLEIFCNLPFESLDRMALKARLDELGVSTPAMA